MAKGSPFLTHCLHAEGKPTNLDGIEGHANARKLNADVVCPAVLHQGDGSTACGGQLPECRVLQDLQTSKQWLITN